MSAGGLSPFTCLSCLVAFSSHTHNFICSGINEGNCHSNNDCIDDLECGTNNCQWGPQWNGEVFTHNCCFDPNPTKCSVDSECGFLGDSFRCGFQNCESGDNCCFDMQDMRCNERLFETYDADGSAKNTQVGARSLFYIARHFN